LRIVRLVVSYDGTDFHGWQAQPGQRTVQGVLEDALSRALEESVEVAGAGRTDAGVHARGQSVSFASASKLPRQAWVPVVNRELPEDVRVVSAEDRDPDFHARHDATGRRYSYRLLDRDDVLLRRFAWFPQRRIHSESLERATRELEGLHDCKSFESAGSPSRHTECRVDRARWSRWEHGLRLDIVANHFLYHMVRTVVGTALAAAEERDAPGSMRSVIAARDRSRAGATAPAQGLCLEEVFYAPRRGPS
jgi:tRNA pseudouridine38-40 synthase